MQLLRNRLSFALLAGLLVLSSGVQAKTKKVKAEPKDPQDEIEVIGHIPLTNGPVKRFLTTQHYSSYYLYAEHDAGSATLINVTKAMQPTVVADVPYPAAGGSGSLFAVVGTAALVTEGQGAAAPASTPQTIRIMDFSDPQHPKVAHEFAGVTAVGTDDRRGLIFVANPDGIWILHQTFAEDPEALKAYSLHILYDH